MKNKNIIIQENAKDDWLARARAHRRKQKGLPALSTLNTDAGNVEHNVSMFNKMNTPAGEPTNNPVSGPFGGDVSAPTASGGMGESLIESMQDSDVVTLYYENLYLEDVPTGKVFRGDYYSPDEYETTDITIEYEYNVDKVSVLEVLQDLPDVQDAIGDVSDEEFQAALLERFDELLEDNEEDVLDAFRDSAEEDARENFDPENYFGESMNTTKCSESLDDVFDMSMRTLL